MTRECVGCGKPFFPRNGNQVRCKPHCGRGSTSRNGARTSDRHERYRHIRFVGVDGEGITRPNGDHKYVLLSVGARSLHREGERLTWRDIFPFLYECFLADPGAAYVGFYLGYDFTHWFRDLPEERARMLLTREGIAKRKPKNPKIPFPFPVYLADAEHRQQWEVDILGMKRFRLRPHNGQNERWMYVCDAGPFYQSSLLVAINPASWPEPIIDHETYELIRKGKDERSQQFALNYDMIRYNVAENDVLSRLMSSMNGGFTRMQIRLQRHQWFGPGQAASAWLDLVDAPSAEETRAIVPQYARDAARATYFGGWFEIFAHGHIPGKSYSYDINSAYPFVISRLPCLLHGTWNRGSQTPVPEQGINIVHASVNGSDRICGSMLHRTTRGNVLRPNRTAGWYWLSEINAAISAGVIDKIDINAWVNYQPCDCPPPLASIAELYQERLRVGKNSPEGRALRISYNSVYGKLAQSIGAPRYASPIYASLITSGCRTMILDAITAHPTRTADLLMVATDGVVFREPHPGLPLSPTVLGEWDKGIYENLTLLMPGIYWHDETRQRVAEGKSPKLKSRGINAHDLAASIKTMDELFEWENFCKVGWPEVEIPVRFSMVTPIQALARGKWQECGRVTTDGTRRITTDPITKRFSAYGLGWLDRGIFRTPPWEDWTPVESSPYCERFGEELRQIMDDEITSEGKVWDVIREALVRE